MSSSAAQLLGLAAGGAAVAALGARHALLVAAVLHLVGACLATSLKSTVAERRRASGRLRLDRTIWRLMLAQWLPAAFVTGGEALLVPYAGVRGFPAGTAGALLAALPVGMLVGDLVVGRFVRPATRERLSPALVVVLGAPLVAVLTRPSLPVLVGLLVVSGCGFSYGLGLQRRFLEAVPEAARGQAFTLLSTGLMTLQGIGPLAAGGLAEWTGPAWAIAAAGVATVASFALVRTVHPDSVS